MTRLILIRHGETDYNLDNRYCGFSDPALNNKGAWQSKRLASRMEDISVDKVYSSDLQRSYVSAQIIFKNNPIEKVRDFREMNFGVFEGLTYKEIMERHPLIYKKWLNNPFSITIPKGEDLGNFKKRIVKALKKIISLNKNKTIAVVSHGGAISIFINHILKSTLRRRSGLMVSEVEPSKDFWKQIPHPAGLSIIEYKNGKARIKLFNDIAHLSKDITYGAQRAT